MSQSPPIQQPRRRQSLRADRRLSQSLTAASSSIRRSSSDVVGGGYEPGELTRLMNNNNRQQQRRSTSILSASFSSFPSFNYNSITEEEEEESKKNQHKTSNSTPNDMYNTTLKAATEHIFGLYAVEVWKFDDSIDLLKSIPLELNNVEKNDDNDDDNIGDEEENNATIPHNTLYIRRKPQESDERSPSFQLSAKEAYEQLTDPTHSDYLPKTETQPGIGLSGLLWSEAARLRNNNLSRMRKQLLRVSLDGEHSGDNIVIDTTLQWRNVDDLASDPDQTYDERLHAFAQAGFHLATAIPFNIFHFRGMVVFFANPHAEECKLNSPNNVRMIQYAAQAIGSVAAMRYENAETVRVKKRMFQKNWRILKAKIMTAVRFRLPIRRASSNIFNGSDINGGKFVGHPSFVLDRWSYQCKTTPCILRATISYQH